VLTFYSPLQEGAKIRNADLGAWLGFFYPVIGKLLLSLGASNPGEENKQIHDKTHLSNEIRLRNKFKVVVFSLFFWLAFHY